MENLLFLVNVFSLHMKQLEYSKQNVHYIIIYLNKEKKCSFHIYLKSWYFIVYG